MCIAVTLQPGSLLTFEEVFQMDRANRDGCGLAWAEDGMVHWMKSTKIDIKDVVEALEYTKKFPRLLHFRLSTAGGITPQLCHPFEIGPLANCNPRGSSSKVMIHNGHWGSWHECKTILERDGVLPDKGPWSDSRLVAFLAHLDSDWLEMLTGKVATMDGKGEITHIGEWQELREGIMVSNKYWATNTEYRGGYEGWRNWQGWKQTQSGAQEQGQSTKGNNTGAAVTVVGASHLPTARDVATRPWYDKKQEKWFIYDRQVKAVVEFTPVLSKDSEVLRGEACGVDSGERSEARGTACEYRDAKNCAFVEFGTHDLCDNCLYNID